MVSEGGLNGENTESGQLPLQSIIVTGVCPDHVLFEVCSNSKVLLKIMQRSYRYFLAFQND